MNEGKTDKGKCFNNMRILNLKEKWEQYNMKWDTKKENVPEELREIIEEIIYRVS